MEEAKDPIIEQLEKLVNHEDLSGLDRLIQSLNAAEIQKYKSQLVEACLEVFYIWYQDLALEKVRKGDEEAVISDLFDILLTAERIDAEQHQHDARARLYEQIAEMKTEPAEKLQNIQHAIEEYEAALKKEASAEMEVRLGSTLLNRMQVTQKFTATEFTAVLHWFKKAFTTWSKTVFINYLHGSFQVLNLPCEDNTKWHLQFMKQLEQSLISFAQQDAFVYLYWSNELLRVQQYEQYAIPTAYAAELSNKAIALLENIKDHQTTDTWQLNELGDAFESAAIIIPADAPHEKLRYYEIAEKYFLKGQSINPAAWTFPVYATNVQMRMARIYYRANDQEKIIALFEAGRTAFATTYEYDQEFTLMNYWGDFLIRYARLAYNFDAPDILQEAESKLLMAKEKGENFYSTTYISLAKVALKMGDKQKCLNILQECKKVFTTEYYEYDFRNVLKDEDFKDVWANIQTIN